MGKCRVLLSIGWAGLGVLKGCEWASVRMLKGINRYDLGGAAKR